MPTDATTIVDAICTALTDQGYFQYVEPEFADLQKIGLRLPAALVVQGSEEGRDEKNGARRDLRVHVFFICQDTEQDPEGLVGEADQKVIDALWHDLPADGSAGTVLFSESARGDGVFAPFGEAALHVRLPPPFIAGRLDVAMAYYTWWT